jgi:hypothetical protein
LALPTANRNAKSKIMLSLLLFALIQNPSAAQPPPDPFTPLAVYNGTWTVQAEHPWSGAAPGTPGNPTLDHLVSRCQRFTLYFACEQTVNGKTQALLVYTVGSSPGKFHCRFISPDGLAGGRGDLTLDGNHWTYLDKPPPTLKGNWSRVENFILDHDHIRFEEYESADEGKTWTKTNSGTEERAPAWSPVPAASSPNAGCPHPAFGTWDRADESPSSSPWSLVTRPWSQIVLRSSPKPCRFGQIHPGKS